MTPTGLSKGRMFTMMIAAGAVAIVTIGGCVAFSPTDVKLVRLEKTDFSTEPEFHDFFGPYGAQYTRKGPLLRIVFSSRTDFVADAGSSDYFYVSALYCDPADRPPVLAGFPAQNFRIGSVYVGDLSLSENSTHRVNSDGKAVAALPRQPDGRIVYSAFIEVARSKAEYPHMPVEQQWDMLNNPHDLCIQVSHGGYMAWSTPPNTITIPVETIRKVLK